jgi:hypothetical protein
VFVSIYCYNYYTRNTAVVMVPTKIMLPQMAQMSET